jgi:4-amino-4-deoxy-L-arabinose transferase-like glycosyltransferase
MRRLTQPIRRLIDETPRRELLVLGAAMVVAFAVVVAYVIARRHAALVGDESEYNQEGIFFTQGKLWWSTTPFGIAHASAWKAPAYPAWVGLWYSILGASHLRVELVQALLAPVTVFLTWLLARRLFGARTAIASALVVAAFPLAWEYYGLLYPEALAIPLTMLVLLLVLGRDATPRRAALVGAVIGITLLVRPTSFFLFAGVAAAWILATGWRRGSAMTAIAIAVAALVVVPWTIRNYVVTDGGFIPLSVQDAASYGTFNAEAASDPVYPYAWRPILRDPPSVLEGKPVNDGVLRSKLQSAALDYIRAHPFSVAEAFYWNGLSRLWDVRRPNRALDEVSFEGRSRTVTGVGLGMYYVLLPLAIVGLWRARRRREVVIPLLAIAIAASVVFTVASGTRYRATLEPVLATLACSAVLVRRESRVTAPALVSEAAA